MSNKILDQFPVVIEKKHLESSLNLAKNIINTSIEDSLQLEDEILKFNKLQSRVNQVFLKELEKITRRGAGIVDKLRIINADVTANINVIEKAIAKEFPTRVPKDHISFRQLTVLQLLSGLEFYSKYVMDFLQFVTAQEYAAIARVDINSFLTKKFISDINSGYSDFMTALESIALPPKSLSDLIAKTSTDTVSGADLEIVKETQGAQSIAPVVFGYIGTQYNIIGRILMGNDRRKAEEYHRTREQKNIYETRLNMLKQLKNADGSVDPALAKRAESLTILIEEMDIKLNELENHF